MSNDAIMTTADQPKVKKDKKEKKSKKVDAAPESSAAVSVASDDKDKKKRKREGEDGVVETEVASEDKPKKKKKEKKDKDSSEATPATSEVSTPVEGSASAPTKKQLKKLAKAAKAETRAANGEDEPVATPSAAAPEDTQLTTSSPAFLAAAASTEATKTFLTAQGITLTPPTYPAFLDMATLPINSAFRPYLAAFTKPTPIQSCSWPPLFVGRDVVGIAETGSGKTLSFGLPGMHRLSTSLMKGKKTGSKGQILLLVLAPTRELALQTHETLAALGKLVGVNAVCLFGGVNKREQVDEIRKKETRVVVGTPGRILDLAESGEVDFSG